jgi:predicted nucleic acid-binding protein
VPATSKSRILLDAGVFISVAHGGRIAMAALKVAAGSATFFIAAHTFTEFYRGGKTTAREAQLINQWRPEVLVITAAEAKLGGELLGAIDGENSMDAILVATAALHRINEIFTTDPADLLHLRSSRESLRTISIVDIS